MIPRPARFLVLSSLLVIIILLLWVRLGYLQVVKHHFYQEKSKNQLRRLIKIYPKRGKIFDRNHKVLANVIPSYDVYIFSKKIKNKELIVPKIAKILSINVQQLTQKMETTVGSFLWLKRHSSLSEIQQLKQLNEPALGYVKTQQRYYPETTLAAQALGFVGVDNQGLEGIEYLYDIQLKGTPGRIFMEGDPRGLPLMSGEITKTPQYDGYHLITTLDSFIQFSAQRHLSQGVSLNQALKGQVIVMNPKTGEVLAMAAYPTLDPNNWQSTARVNRKNACVVDVYEPGSMFKPIIIASVLEENIVTPGTIVMVPEELQVFDRTVNEAHGRPEGETDEQSVADILEKSLNVGTSLLAQSLGDEQQYAYINKFGFGKRTGIKLPGESRGISRHHSKWSKVDSAMISFGQGIAVTSLQMATAISCIANQGKCMQPHILKYKANADFTTHKATPLTVKSQVIRPEVAQAVSQIMTRVVTHGTAKNVRIPGYTIAGKTGTAQKAKENGLGYEPGKYIASFVGFFPVEDPEYVILVTVDSPQRSIWGSSVAAPIFKKIALDIIHYFNLPPQV